MELLMRDTKLINAYVVQQAREKKRQELFKNINPLLKKYKYDGEVPPSYILADKRAKITTYMGRSSFAPGYYGKLF